MKLLATLLGISLFINASFIFQNWQRNVVVSVPDGDSIQLRDGRRVRLLGLDAPERGRCMANEARETLDVAARNRHVRLKNVVTDDYGRQLADVFVFVIPGLTRNPSESHLNRLMVSHGLARYSGATKNEYHDVLKAAQSQAKTDKLGIWSDACRIATNPDCSIKGNIRDGKKTFFLPDCPNYDQTIIDTSFGDEWFCTEEEAVKAGFSKASGCSK